MPTVMTGPAPSGLPRRQCLPSTPTRPPRTEAIVTTVQCPCGINGCFPYKTRQGGGHDGVGGRDPLGTHERSLAIPETRRRARAEEHRARPPTPPLRARHPAESASSGPRRGRGRDADGEHQLRRAAGRVQRAGLGLREARGGDQAARRDALQGEHPPHQALDGEAARAGTRPPPRPSRGRCAAGPAADDGTAARARRGGAQQVADAWKKNRNAYSKLLLAMLRSGPVRLEAPFDRKPGEGARPPPVRRRRRRRRVAAGRLTQARARPAPPTQAR